jgi:hypothetical protein
LTIGGGLSLSEPGGRTALHLVADHRERRDESDLNCAQVLLAASPQTSLVEDEVRV